MIKNVLDGNMESTAYEDTLREMFGIHAYIAFTLDKVVTYAVRQVSEINIGYFYTRHLCFFFLGGGGASEIYKACRYSKLCVFFSPGTVAALGHGLHMSAMYGIVPKGATSAEREQRGRWIVRHGVHEARCRIVVST